MLPFELTEEVMKHLSALQSYSQVNAVDLPAAMDDSNNDSLASTTISSGASCNWLELNVIQEVIHLVHSRVVSSEESLQPYINSENAR